MLADCEFEFDTPGLADWNLFIFISSAEYEVGASCCIVCFLKWDVVFSFTVMV